MRDYQSFQFDRGDIVNVGFERLDRDTVSAGDTIAIVRSQQLNERLVQLGNQLAIERARLRQLSTGQKPEIRNAAVDEKRLARQELELRQKQYDRMKGLVDEGLVSQNDFEVAATALDQARTRLELAESRRTVVETGEKPEDIDLAKANIAAIQREISFIKSTAAVFTLQSPLSGFLRFETDVESDKLIVEDVSAQIFVIPIRLDDRAFLAQHKTIPLTVEGTKVEAEVLSLSDRVEYLHGEPVVFLKVMVDYVANTLPGMPIQCTVKCDEVKPLEYLTRSVRWE